MNPHLMLTLQGLVLVIVAWLTGRGVILTDPIMLNRHRKVRKLFSGLLWGVGVFILLGQFLFSTATEEDVAEKTGLVWIKDLDEGIRAAGESGKPILVDAWATWCAACKDFDKNTLQDEAVAAELGHFVAVKLDLTDPDLFDTVAERLGFSDLPWTAVLTQEGEVVTASVLNEDEEPQKFIARLKKYGPAATGGALSQEEEGADSDRVSAWLRDKGFVLTLLLVFVGGLAASLTPCAYPAYFLIFGFLSMGGTRTRRQSLLMSLLTVAGIVAMYVGMGILAALGGGSIGKVMSNPFVMGGIAGLFLLMAVMSLRLLPFREFARFKTFLATRQKATYLWAFIFGLVLGLIVAPCVGPIVIGILTYIAQGQDIVKGAALMSAFGLGMVTLFLFLGVFSHLMTRRPQVGKIGEAATVAFGILFFTAALYYLKGVIPYDTIFPWLAGRAG